MFIIHDLRNYSAMLEIPNALLNLLPGLGRKDGLFDSKFHPFLAFVASCSACQRELKG